MCANDVIRFTLAGHFIMYTLLVQRWTPPLLFSELPSFFLMSIHWGAGNIAQRSDDHDMVSNNTGRLWYFNNTRKISCITPAWSTDTRQDGWMLSCCLRQTLMLPFKFCKRNQDSQTKKVTVLSSLIILHWQLCPYITHTTVLQSTKTVLLKGRTKKKSIFFLSAAPVSDFMFCAENVGLVCNFWGVEEWTLLSFYFTKG